MCIRDRLSRLDTTATEQLEVKEEENHDPIHLRREAYFADETQKEKANPTAASFNNCLLYTSFDRNPSGMVLLHRGLSTLFFFLALAGAAGGALAVWLRNPTARLSAYVLLVKKRRGQFLRRWLGLDFSRYFSCCLKEGCPTQTTLTLLQKLPKKTFLKLMSWHVEQALLAGESLETALGSRCV